MILWWKFFNFDGDGIEMDVVGRMGKLDDATNVGEFVSF